MESLASSDWRRAGEYLTIALSTSTMERQVENDCCSLLIRLSLFSSDGSESDWLVWLKWSDCYDGKLCDVYSTVCRSKCAYVVVSDVVLSLLLSCTQLRGVCPCSYENWFSSLSMQFSVPWIYVCRRGWGKKTFVPVRTIITRDRVVSVAKLIMSHNYILWHCDIFPRGLYQQRICHWDNIRSVDTSITPYGDSHFITVYHWESY